MIYLFIYRYHMWIQDILTQKKRILALSPMADMTDSPFCQIVRSIGGADVVYREMVSSEAIVRDNEKTMGMTDFVESERPIVQQIFGSDPYIMAKAAEKVMEHAHPEGIDLNMGCPVYKITSNFNGAALMKDPCTAAAIIKEIKKAIGKTPLSVKIRLGWSDPDDFKTFIPVIEEAGAELITVHGRTKTQGYSGKSDWERIRQAKEIATVPLLANGDIHDPIQVEEALAITKADGVLIARGALGNPWFFKQAIYPEYRVSREERLQVIMNHAMLHVAHHSKEIARTKPGLSLEEYERMAIVSFRKHLSWYVKGTRLGEHVAHVKEWRSKLVQITSLAQLELLLQEMPS
jgi:tRNA-dihydrouridine synthase B